MIYVVAQFCCIIFLIVNADFSQLGYSAWSLLLIGWVVGVLAVFNMQIGNLNILPKLKTNHQLITHGIYRYIRHPMYTSLILQALAMVFSNPKIVQWLVYFTLIVVLFLKSKKEEMYLRKGFKDYASYQKKTDRFLPFL